MQKIIQGCAYSMPVYCLPIAIASKFLRMTHLLHRQLFFKSPTTNYSSHFDNSERSWVKQQRKELPAHLFSDWNRRDAFEGRRIGSRTHTVAEDVDDGRAPLSTGAILERAVNHQRVMKRSPAFLQLDCDGLKLSLLLFAQDHLNRVHVICESGDGQKIPAIAAWYVMEAAVLARRVVQP